MCLSLASARLRGATRSFERRGSGDRFCSCAINFGWHPRKLIKDSNGGESCGVILAATLATELGRALTPLEYDVSFGRSLPWPLEP